MKKSMYLCVVIAMVSLLCLGCRRSGEAPVFELEQDSSDTVSAQENGDFQLDSENLKSILQESLASLEIQVSCSCTGETQVQQVAVEPLQVPQEDTGKVNINTADAAALQTLNGIGETRAQAIISYRESYGAFQSIEDIKQVSGIKDGIFLKIRDDIFVG